MKNGDTPAYPLAITEDPTLDVTYGLTKRERFAMAAMQGLCANSIAGPHHHPDERARDAAATADALLKALEEL